MRIHLKDAAPGISGLSAVGAALLLNLLLTPIAFGHEPKPTKKTTLVGHIVGTACYMGHESKGEDHLACATECAKAGIPLAIVDSGTGKLKTARCPNAPKPKNRDPSVPELKQFRRTGEGVFRPNAARAQEGRRS